MSHYLRVNFTLTLMQLVEGDVYVGGDERDYPYYFQVADDWVNLPDKELQNRAYAVAQTMYADIARSFQAAEPNDPNYIAVLRCQATFLTEQELQEQPWWYPPRPPVWEWTNCVVVQEADSYTKVHPGDFDEALGLPRGEPR
jgi:hypothetical protein